MNDDYLCRALVVDDNKLERDLIKALLLELGAEIVGEAENGEEAIQAFNELKPDISFLDIRMPVKNGIDALKEIIKKDPNAIVVMLTAVSETDIADSCIDLGAKKYVRKGTSPAIMTIMLQAGLDFVGTV